MTQGKHEEAVPTGIGRYVPLLAYVLVAMVIVLIPLKVISIGYLPPDDALADAAKAVNGKPWPEILVLKASYGVDNHIGWHTFLRQVYLGTDWDADRLVLFSVISLFTLLGWSALPWLRRPEAWLITLILVPGIGMEFMGRFMLGRPLVLSITVLVTLLFLWNACGSSPPGKGLIAFMTVLIATAALLHGVWYFWGLPVAAFCIARQFRWAGALTVSWLAGSVLAGVITGHPASYLIDAVRQAFSVMGNHLNERTQVSEMQPTAGNMFGLMLLGGLLLLRHLAKLDSRPWRTSPVFWLVCLGWVLGYKAARFWEDWGLPALMVLMAVDLQLLLEKQLAFRSLQRLALTAGLAATLYLTATCDVQSRWTRNLITQNLSPDKPGLAGWLPEPGGIFYAADMEFFFQTFYQNPKAQWRYVVGFETIFMTDEDFATYEQILWNNGDPGAYLPWVKKMRPPDRLVMRAGPAAPPPIPELEWNYAANNLWIGRLPRPSSKVSGPSPPPVPSRP
jgi:hypothetical protein